MPQAAEPSPDAPSTSPPWAEQFPPIRYWARVGAVVIGLVVAVRVVVALEGVLIVVAASAVLAIGLQPTIRWLEDRGIARGWAMGAIMVGGLVLVGALAAITIPMVVAQVGDLVRMLPERLAELREGDGVIARLDEQLDLSGRLSGAGDELPGGLVGVARTVGAGVFQLALVLILTPYFALGVPSAKRWIVRLLRRGDREDALFLLNRSTDLMANYIAGNLLVSAIAGAVAFVGLLAIGVPYATSLAVFVAVTDMIPAIGATLGAVAVVAVASLEGVTQMVLAGMLILVYQQVENYVIVPRVMRSAIDVSPASGIIALLAGGTLAGPIGALLALPVAAMLKIVLEELVLADRIADVRADDARAEREGGGRTRRRARMGESPLP